MHMHMHFTHSCTPFTGNVGYETSGKTKKSRREGGEPLMQALGFTSDDPCARMTKAGKSEFLQSLSE